MSKTDVFALLHPDEEWRTIPLPPGHKSYEASSYGRIRQADNHKILPPRFKATGGCRSKVPYLRVDLIRTAEHPRIEKDYKTTKSVHTLVCSAWYGERPPKTDADHRNHDFIDNTPINLRWRDSIENCVDRRPRMNAV